ncbi:unnamed protein product [Ixodes persulcatus]
MHKPKREIKNFIKALQHNYHCSQQSKQPFLPRMQQGNQNKIAKAVNHHYKGCTIFIDILLLCAETKQNCHVNETSSGHTCLITSISTCTKLYLIYKHSICKLCGQSRRNIEKQPTTS